MSAAITTTAATQQSCNDAPRSSGSRLRHLQQRRRKKSTLIPLGHATANANGALLHPEADDDDEHSRLPNPFSVAISLTAGPAAATVTAGAAQGLVDAGVGVSNASASPDDDGCKLDGQDDDDEGDEGDDDDNADDDDGEPEQSQCADGSSELLGWSDAQPQDALGNAAASTARVRGAASTQRQYVREDDAAAGWSMPGDLEPASYATRMSMSSLGVAATAHRDAAAAAAAAAEQVQALQAKTLALQSEATAAALTLEQARRERKLRAVRMEIATLRAELERDATIV